MVIMVMMIGVGRLDRVDGRKMDVGWADGKASVTRLLSAQAASRPSPCIWRGAFTAARERSASLLESVLTKDRLSRSFYVPMCGAQCQWFRLRRDLRFRTSALTVFSARTNR